MSKENERKDYLYKTSWIAVVLGLACLLVNIPLDNEVINDTGFYLTGIGAGIALTNANINWGKTLTDPYNKAIAYLERHPDIRKRFEESWEWKQLKARWREEGVV